MKNIRNKFPKFDASEIEKYRDPQHFFLKDISLDFAHKILSNKTQDNNDPIGSNAFELLREEINENYPQKIEGKKNILGRVAQAKAHIKHFIENVEMDNDSKIVLVGHSYYFKMWTGKWERELSSYGDEIPEPVDSVWLKNCQFHPDGDYILKSK